MEANVNTTKKSADQIPVVPAKQTLNFKPGTPYVAGTPVPEGAFVCPHEGGMMTLEVAAREGFDKDVREKVLKAVDKAFTLAIQDPSDEHPDGVRPYLLLVNREFRKHFKGVRQWGELEPPCEVEIASDDDARFNAKGAVRIENVKARFITTNPELEE